MLRQEIRRLLQHTRVLAPPNRSGTASIYAAHCAPRLLCPASCYGSQSDGRPSKGINDTAYYVGAVVVGMLGLSYASVPLYQMFCQATGYGGTVRINKTVEDKLLERAERPNEEMERLAAKREIRVWFSADVADNLPWRFRPAQQFVTVKPGQTTLAFYHTENLSDEAITGVSTYNVQPDNMGYYFNKVQCFCFEEQRLRPHEAVDMPLLFYLDPEMVLDWHVDRVNDVTLSYTFFRVEDEEETEERGQQQQQQQQEGGLDLSADRSGTSTATSSAKVDAAATDIESSTGPASSAAQVLSSRGQGPAVSQQGSGVRTHGPGSSPPLSAAAAAALAKGMGGGRQPGG